MFTQLMRDEGGAIISAELVLVLTILVIGVIVGLNEVAVAVNTELNDVSNAIGSIDQSFFFSGMKGVDGVAGKVKSGTAGSRFTDSHDDCDKNTTCDLVCGPPAVDTCG